MGVITVSYDSELGKLLYDIYECGRHCDAEFPECCEWYDQEALGLIAVLHEEYKETFEIRKIRDKICLIHGCWEHPWFRCGCVTIPKEMVGEILSKLVEYELERS